MLTVERPVVNPGLVAIFYMPVTNATQDATLTVLGPGKSCDIAVQELRCFHSVD